MSNSGLTNVIIRILIIQTTFKMHSKWKKVVKQCQNRVNFILVAQVGKNNKGALQEYRN